jgi:hypothetical protein
MKFVVLVDGCCNNDFEKMKKAVGEKESVFIETQNQDEIHEFKKIINNIKEFSKSTKKVMLARFSGRESIVNITGDELSEMIIPMSNNKESRFYTGNPVDTFLKLLTIFNEETIDKIS